MAERAQEEVDDWRYDDDQRHSGETLVKNTSDACAEYLEKLNITQSSQEQRRLCSRWWRHGTKCTGAAKELAPRRGLGMTRQVTNLWLQEVTTSGRVKMRRLLGEQHLSDHMTKGNSGARSIVRGVGGRTKVNQSNKGNEHGWQGGQRHHGTNIARIGMCQGREGTESPAG